MSKRSLILVVGALGLVECVGSRAPINRVQPDYLDKADLIPVQYAALSGGAAPETLSTALLAREPAFYTQTTIIAKPATIGFTGITSYSDSNKIRWEVSERFLIAREAYEFLHNAPSGSGGVGQKPQVGDVAAVYAISKHFDIRRDYNSTTGEELNVIDENSSDRPWYQRRYMRVDWSQNLISGYNSAMFYADLEEGRVRSEPVPVFINTPNDPNAPVFEYQGDGPTRKLTYFDVVNRAVLHPEELSVNWDGTNYRIPLCWLSHGASDCAPAELAFRAAYRRVDPNRDFEPASLSVPLPGSTVSSYLDFERFGFFDQLRVGYDSVQHAELDSQRLHFASRHNMWLYHHALVFGADTNQNCNSDADCSGGNVCHIKNEPAASDHRGFCAPLALAHDKSDIPCNTDNDCLQTDIGTGVSRTAVCDSSTKTCGEHFYRCAVDADCTSVDQQSYCDQAVAYTRADNRGLCLMPFRQRQVRPIPYHESPNYPGYMQPVTEQIVKEWNDAFLQAVVAARRHECEIEKNIDPTAMSVDANPCNAAAVTGLDPKLGADAKFIFLGCHSPVWGSAEGTGQHSQADVDAAHAKGWDLPACGAQSTVSRLGDLRYSMIGAIPDYDAQGYWGLANIASDPETGEMIVGRGAVWQTITDTYGAWLVELVKALNGDIDIKNIADGSFILDSMKQLGSGQTPSAEVLDQPLREVASLSDLTGKTGLARMVLPGAGWFTPDTGLTLKSKDPNKPGALEIGRQRMLKGRLFGDGNSRAAQRLASLRGTSLEAMMMNNQQVLLAPTGDQDPGSVLPRTLEAASPLRQQSPEFRRVLERLRQRVSAWECDFEAPFSDDMLLGLAQRLKDGPPILASDPEDGPIAFGRDWDFKNGTDYELMRYYAAQFIHHGVLAHELGHSIGQRHNFTASADAINYFDNYWKIRGKGHPDKVDGKGNHDRGLRPRYEYLADPADGKYYSKEEIAGRVDEWAYSSVMDYKGLNEDARGIGRYDYAFVKGGYVNMVEAFKNVKDFSAGVVYSSQTAGTGVSLPLDLRDWQKQGGNGPIHGVHYVQIPKIFGAKPDGTPDIGDDNRYNVFLRETAEMSIDGWGSPDFTNVTTDGHLLVPYRFDTDGRAGLVWQDQRYDAGPDPYESLHYVTSHLLDYYFQNSFAHLRSGFSTGKYVDRMWMRYMEQLHQVTQMLFFEIASWQDFFGTGKNFQDYANKPSEYGGYVNQVTMSMSADTLVSLLTMPEVGRHKLLTQFDGTKLMTQVYNGSVDIPINQGRFFESNWRNDTGGWWYEHLNRAGAYYDRLLSVFSLTDPELYLLGRDTPVDIRRFKVSFYTMFPEQTLRLFGGVLAEDTNDFAPIVSTVGTPVVQRTNLATLNLPTGKGPGTNGRVFDNTHQAIDPQAQFTVQLMSAILTTALFPSTYDQRYMEFSRLWVDGALGSISVKDPDKNTVSFTDPWSHQTFRALHMGTGAGDVGEKVGGSPYVHPATGKVAEEAGIAARMILHLQDIDALRNKAIADNKPAEAAQLELQEHKYLDLVNSLRELTVYLGNGKAAWPE